MMEYPRYYRTPLEYFDGKSEQGLRMNEIVPQNLVRRLQAREMWGGRRVGTEKYLERSMYQSIFPNFTVSHVEKPPCFLRKFTPDGKNFIAFSSEQMCVEVYTFLGPEAAARLFAPVTEDNPRAGCSRTNPCPYSKDKTPWLDSDHIVPEDNDPRSQYLRSNIFSYFFKLKYKINVAPQGEQLNRECSLFTEDSRYMIVGSANYIQDEFVHPQYYDIYRNNECVEPNPKFPLEDYSIHLVDIRHGVLSDSVSFKVDKIFLSHNQGIYLYNQTLAVLSVQHQTIHIFHVIDGQFYPVRTVGRFCFEDDELVTSVFRTTRPYDETFISTLKHRLLVYIYKRALDSLTNNQERGGITRFYQYFEQLRKLKIWKMQLLDEDHLLLKYSSEDVVTLKCIEPNSQHCIFVVYSIRTTEILSIFENTSDVLVQLFENFSDSFRNNFITPDARYSSSPANNIYSRQIQQRFRHTITSARFGGPVEATRRILAQLPISAQSFSASPYLDQALFCYDDHRVSIMERPKACGEVPIRFYGRDSGVYKFQIHAGILARSSSNAGRRLVAFTFHPSSPFAISVQRANSEYLVNFHFRFDRGASCPT